MVLTMHRGGTSPSTLQVLSVPAYVRKKALNPDRHIEYTHVWMIGKSPGVQFGIQFSTLNVGSISRKWQEGGTISEPLKQSCVDTIFFSQATQFLAWASSCLVLAIISVSNLLSNCLFTQLSTWSCLLVVHFFSYFKLKLLYIFAMFSSFW